MSTHVSTAMGKKLNDPDVEKWSHFIENLHRNTKGIPGPFKAVDTLARKYLTKDSTGFILDIGCETGKNAIPLIKAGHKVTLLDIAPNAIRYTKENIQQLGLEHGVVNSINGKIETLDQTYGPFKAVVGTYAFSFIPPNLFEEVMKNNVLGRVESGGYFAGGFFGEKHVWAKDPELSILTRQKLKKLFSSMGFSICEIEEKTEETQTVFDGKQIFHTIEIIAKRAPKTKLHQMVNIVLKKLRFFG